MRSSLYFVTAISLLGFGCANAGSNGTLGGGGGTGNQGTGVGAGGDPNALPPGTTVLGDIKNCGNAAQDANEQCDDANKVGGDGCSPLCQMEADYVCPTFGQPCSSNAVCGNGAFSSVEACDDSNTNAGDGCAADCKTVEPGWQCRAPGKPCTALCGDGVQVGGEPCDDANAADGDGCSSTCLKEPGYDCTGTPSVCTKAVCGNSVVETGEDCDKGPANGLFHGDATGCSKTCTQEPNCRDASGATTACVTRCGDGNVDTALSEACDDGNGAAGDGCSPECAVEGGFTCEAVAKKDTQPCASGTGECLVLPITYRDFDGTNVPLTGHPDFSYMGATPTGGTKTLCVPNASGRAQGKSGECPGNDSTALCLGLAKDTLDTDGKPAANTARAGGLTCACQYTDWNHTGILDGLTTNTNYTISTCSSGGSGTVYVINQKAAPVIQSAASFKQWYNDSTFSTKSVGTLELGNVAGTNTYQFTASNGRTIYDDLHDIWLAKNSKPAVSTTPATSLSSGFFPLDSSTGAHASTLCNLWPYWTAPATCIGNQWDSRAGDGSPPPGAEVANTPGMKHNYYFSTEARYLFRFVGGETLAFHGDDDVWVYVNGKLVLDLGAPHERLEGTVQLTAAGSTAVVRSQIVATGAFENVGTQSATNLGLEVGKTYEIAIFHADHHPRDSNYQLTLSGFSREVSTCKPTCGDGVATIGEECDLGAANQDGLYGGCTTACKWGPFCGDAVVDAEEQCDLGVKANDGKYGTGGCTSTCTKAHYCGDGILDSAFGEQCDGAGSCSAECTISVT